MRQWTFGPGAKIPLLETTEDMEAFMVVDKDENLNLFDVDSKDEYVIGKLIVNKNSVLSPEIKEKTTIFTGISLYLEKPRLKAYLGSDGDLGFEYNTERCVWFSEDLSVVRGYIPGGTHCIKSNTGEILADAFMPLSASLSLGKYLQVVTEFINDLSKTI